MSLWLWINYGDSDVFPNNYVNVENVQAAFINLWENW